MVYLLGDPRHLAAVALRLVAVGAVGALVSRRWRSATPVGIVALLAVAWTELSGLTLPSNVPPGLRSALWAEYAVILGGLVAGALLLTLGRRRRQSRPAA